MTPSPRRHAQPRTLFFAANRPLADLPSRPPSKTNELPSAFPVHALRSFPPDGVLLWIREDLPGPATNAWPPPSSGVRHAAWDFRPVADGLAARWSRLRWLRAGVEQRRTRYSLWIVSGPRATTADRRRGQADFGCVR